MNKEHIQLRRLEETDCLSKFDCGDDDLNDFIMTDAFLYFKVRLATSYILENTENGIHIVTDTMSMKYYKKTQ